MKAIRGAMALNMIYMKVFGFADGEPATGFADRWNGTILHFHGILLM